MKAQSQETELPQAPAVIPANATKATRKRIFPVKIKAPGRKMRRVLILYAALLIVAAFAGRGYKQHSLNNELMDAIKAKQSLAVVTRLLNEGADANVTVYAYHVMNEDSYGGDQMALGIAAERGDIPLAQVLLEHKADPAMPGYIYHVFSDYRYSLLSIAASKNQVAMPHLLFKRV